MDSEAGKPPTLVICCGAIANEIVTIIRVNGWDHMKVECLPAKLHKRSRRPAGGRTRQNPCRPGAWRRGDRAL